MQHQELANDAIGGFDQASHLAWLKQHRDALLDFYQPQVCDPAGGMAYLSNDGSRVPSQGHALWIGTRMIHVFAVAEMLGREGASDVVEHGLDFYVDGPGFDREHGGFFACVGGDEPSERKELYGQAFAVLAGASAMTAGHARGATLLERALQTIDQHFWVEADQAGIDALDRDFSGDDGYRGQNANMHLTEAYLAAYEATGEQELLDRAYRLAMRITSKAAEADAHHATWRLPEHYDAQWKPLLEFNRDQPRHPFKPYGSQPGHWLEWSKLLLQLKGAGVDASWLSPAAANLFHGAFADGWHDNGGFAYTVDWDGQIVVPEKYFWEPCEGLGAARMLYLDSGQDAAITLYAQMWDFIEEHFVDSQHGSWFPELDINNQPVTNTWPGKPDVYHAFQATLYAHLPLDQGVAAWAKQQAEG